MKVIKLERSAESYKQIRELLREHELNTSPTYCGWGVEVYDRHDTQTQLVVNWDNYTATVKVGYSDSEVG